MPTCAAIILAGGRSSRMGSPKAALDWHGSTLLRRVTGIAARTVDGPVVVVRAPGQELPELHHDVEIVDDAREGRGPLQGLAAGLAAIGDRAQFAYATSTDVPLLHPAFIARVLGAADDAVDVVLPDVRGHRQPLAAAYRTGLLDLVDELLAADRLRPAFLFERCRVVSLDDAAMLADSALARADPQLVSVDNLNEPADYERALARAAPEIAVRRFGTLAGGDGARRHTVRAWSLGELAATAGVELEQRHVVAALNGDRISSDPELPLVAGDEIALMAADAGG
ncbi:MAG: NTP transferase domain-containing protein [Solirubrobacteraceae bacterium]